MKPEIKIPLDYEKYPEPRKSRLCALSIKDCLSIFTILSAVAFVLFLLFACHPAFANGNANTNAYDYYQEQGFTLEQIEEMQRQAKAEWKAEHGDIPPALSARAEKEIQQYLTQGAKQ